MPPPPPPPTHRPGQLVGSTPAELVPPPFQLPVGGAGVSGVGTSGAKGAVDAPQAMDLGSRPGSQAACMDTSYFAGGGGGVHDGGGPGLPFGAGSGMPGYGAQFGAAGPSSQPPPLSGGPAPIFGVGPAHGLHGDPMGAGMGHLQQPAGTAGGGAFAAPDGSVHGGVPQSHTSYTGSRNDVVMR